MFSKLKCYIHIKKIVYQTLAKENCGIYTNNIFFFLSLFIPKFSLVLDYNITSVVLKYYFLHYYINIYHANLQNLQNK